MPLTLVSNNPPEVLNIMTVVSEHLHALEAQPYLVPLDAAAANTKRVFCMFTLQHGTANSM